MSIDADLRETYRRYIAAINAHDFANLDEFAHDRLTVNGQPTSRDDWVDSMHAHAAALEGLTWRVDDLLVDGDRLSARLTDSATPIAEWMGFAPTGASIEFAEFAFYHFRAGRFDSVSFLVDLFAIQQQLRPDS